MSLAARSLRVGLALFALAELVIGGWAMLAPGTFWANFPVPGHPWTGRLGPYNEHLLRDFGAFNLAFALMFAIGARTLDRLVIRTGLLGYLVFGVFHLVFHLNHLHPFSVWDSVMQVVSLAGAIAACLVLLALTRVAHLSTSCHQQGDCRQPAAGSGCQPPAAVRGNRVD